MADIDPTLARWQGRVDQQLANHDTDLRELRSANSAISQSLSEVKVSMVSLASKEDLNTVRVAMANLASKQDVVEVKSAIGTINSRIAYAAGCAFAGLGGLSLFFNWYFG